jgi:hypothetical protein
MAKFAFTSDGHFVNLDLITTMRVKGTPGKLDSMEIWFAGNTHADSGLYLSGHAADELFDEMQQTHKIIGYPHAVKETSKD